MKIFSASQIKEWDLFTIKYEPVSSIDLMERAARQCAGWIIKNTDSNTSFAIFCGPGNNGGDGLAIARMLIEQQRRVTVYILQQASFSADFTSNLQRLRLVTSAVHYLIAATDFPELPRHTVIIDALFGYGLNRPLEGVPGALVQHINQSGAPVISIDMPSGLFADKSSLNNDCIKAAHTLTFQQLKLAFLLPENQDYTGFVTVIDIQLHLAYYRQTESQYELVSKELLQSFIQPRKRFAHKGNYGNLALIAGSDGMMGAAVLAARACLRSGAGKLTCYIPGNGYTIMQTSVPEAMCVADQSATQHSRLLLKGKYDGYAIGPGLGSYNSNIATIETLLAGKPPKLVADADALNTIAQNQALLQQLPSNTIITPHPKEFERLFGPSANHFERLQLALAMAQKYGIIIILKGSYSLVATPGGKAYFNPTGNPGMATGGSGDVLTGILLGLSGQYEDAVQVALLGVYLHGLAGDVAAAEKTEEAMIAGDITQYLPQAFKTLKTV